MLSAFVSTHLPPSFSMCVDSVESEYSFHHHISPTNLQPDVVWWSDEVKDIRLLELTISYETVMEQARQRKLAKYEDVVEEARVQGYNAECFAVEAGVEGFESGGRATAAEECTRCPCQGHYGVSWVSVQDCNAQIFQDLVLQKCAAVTLILPNFLCTSVLLSSFNSYFYLFGHNNNYIYLFFLVPFIYNLWIVIRSSIVHDRSQVTELTVHLHPYLIVLVYLIFFLYAL